MKLADIALNKNVKYNEHLHPKIWDANNKLKSEVRSKLVEIAESYIEFLEISKSTVEDYLVVGSAANYNWNEYSDIDLHIVIDFEKAGESCNAEITEEWLMAKRALWIERYDITINGLQVEVGPQDVNVDLTSEAVYSVLENKWLKKPKLNPPKLDEPSYDKKLKQMLDKANALISGKASSDEIDTFLDSLRDMRQSSLDKTNGGTEFSTNNLVYKTLRNQGILDKLKELRIDRKSEELSL